MVRAAQLTAFCYSSRANYYYFFFFLIVSKKHMPGGVHDTEGSPVLVC